MFKNRPVQRILIFGASVFEREIESLLKAAVDLQVLGAKYTNDMAFLDDIARNRPDAIVLNETAPLNTARILKLLFSIPSLNGLRIVVVRPDNNTIDVYTVPKNVNANGAYKLQQFTITKQDELVSVIRG